MHRSEAEGAVACAACGSLVDPGRERAYGFGSQSTLCWACALSRGGDYDEMHDRWMRAPEVDDLAENQH
jgi:hypothetical protein